MSERGREEGREMEGGPRGLKRRVKGDGGREAETRNERRRGKGEMRKRRAEKGREQGEKRGYGRT